MAAAQPVLAVRVGDWDLALPTRHIHRVYGYRHHPPPTPLPDSPPWLAGLIDGPAGLTPVIHLSRLAGLGGGDARRDRLLVLRGRPALALRVDATLGLRRLRLPLDRPVPQDHPLAPYLDGGRSQDDGTTLWRLDPARLARLHHPQH